jgi:hypothetical protein
MGEIMKCDHLIGWWSDGYDFISLTESEVKTTYLGKPTHSYFVWFKYCPDCGQKLEEE